MLNKKIVCGTVALVVATAAAFASVEANAVGFGLDLNGETEVAVGETITLSAEHWVANDIYIPELPNGGMGEVSREVVNDLSQWSSSDESVATVDSQGTVTGISEGTVTISVDYASFGDSVLHSDLEITVKAGGEPSDKPSEDPSEEPSDEPSEDPSEEPSDEPSEEPSEEPSDEPSEKPAGESSQPSVPSPVQEKPVNTGSNNTAIGITSVVAASAFLIAGIFAKRRSRS